MSHLSSTADNATMPVPHGGWEQVFAHSPIAMGIAVDFREDVAPLPREAVERIVAMMEAEGMTAKVSSIHVNGWFGRYDKLAMTRTFLAEALAIDLDAAKERFVFAGDSPNDAPMFAYFPNAVGVANVRAFLDRIPTPPAWITRGEAGEGFVELADFLLGSGWQPGSQPGCQPDP